MPERNLVPVPDRMPADRGRARRAGGASRCTRCASSTVPANAVALVIGAGPIGAFAAQWLRVLGVVRGCSWPTSTSASGRDRRAPRLRDDRSPPGRRATRSRHRERDRRPRRRHRRRGQRPRAITFLQAVDAAAHHGQVAAARRPQQGRRPAQGDRVAHPPPRVARARHLELAVTPRGHAASGTWWSHRSGAR